MVIASLTLVATLAAAAPSMVTTLKLPFGHGPRDLGVSRDDEASPEAPGSFAVDDDGRVYVLDAVHHRVAVFFKGDLVGDVALGSDTVEDIALDVHGDVVVLDRVVDRSVSVVAANGSVVARAAVEGKGVDDGGDVTGVFADDTGVWVEVLRGAQVRVLDADGKVDVERATRPGLPFADGYVRLRKIGDDAQVLFFDRAQKLVDSGVVRFSSTLRLAGLAVRGDRLFVAAHELAQKTPTSKPTRDVIVVVELQKTRSGLKEIARTATRASPEFVPMKELVTTSTGVAHLYVDSLQQTGAEVASW